MADVMTDAIRQQFQTPKDPNAPQAPRPEEAISGPYTGDSTTGIAAPVTQGATQVSGGTTPQTAVEPVPMPTNTNTSFQAQAPTPIDPNTALSQVGTFFQTTTGRPMTPAEQQQLIGALNLQPGAPITKDTIVQAEQIIKQWYAGQGATAPTATQPPPPTGTTTPPPPAPAAPGGSIDPNVANNQIQSSFQQRFGRPMTAAEQQQLIAAVGLQPGQPVTQAMLDQAMQLVSTYNGGAQPGTQPGTQPGAPATQPGAPATQPGTQPAAPAGIDPNVAMNQVSAAFQSRFGRPMTSAEQQQLIAAAGLQPGQPITQEIIDRALAQVAAYSPGAGAQPGAGTQPGTGTQPGGTQPGSTPGTTPSIDPNVAQNQVKASFKARFGRDPTAAEMQWLISQSGYTSGQVTPDQLAAAMASVSNYTGNMGEPIDVDPADSPEVVAANARLQELLQENWGEIDPNSEAMRTQRNAFGLQSQRGADRQRAAAAERAAQRGSRSTGGFDVGQDAILQKQGEGEQAFESQLISKELDGQRNRLMQGIEMAKQFGMQEQAQDLQEELAKLELQIRQQGQQGQLGLGLLNSNRSAQQFADSLGLSLAQLQNLMNNQAMQGMFGL